jgi:hypothetical protein
MPNHHEDKRSKVHCYMAIGKINRGHYVQALLGIVWASSIHAQPGDFKNAHDLLKAMPSTVGATLETDASLFPEAKEAIRRQASGAARGVYKESSSDRTEEDAILAEAERLLNNELLNRKSSLSTSLPLPKAVSFKGEAPVQDSLIRLSLVSGRLHIEPEVLDLADHSEATVAVQDLEQVPQVFLRDPTRVQWDGKRFQGLAKGKTEIYFVYQNEMYILPVRVGTGSVQGVLADLGSERLTSLKMPESFASMTPGAQASTSSREDLSIAEASLQAKQTKQNDVDQQRHFIYSSQPRSYRDTAIQVMDIRSNSQAGKIYPLAGVTVQLMGLGIAAKTDASGLARFGDLPAGSRLWAMVADEEGRVVPTVNEIVVSTKGKAQVQRIRSMAYNTYANYQDVLNINQNFANGSICARVLNHDSKGFLEGISVQINDERAEGPFYISEHGPQPGQRETSANGRFCFFNVKPGLAELSFFQDGKYQSAVSLPIFPGAHSEEDLPLSTGRASNLYLASMPNAMDQLTGDDSAANTLESVVTAHVISVGENEALPATSESVLSQIPERSEFKGRTYSLVQTAEFENTLQADDRDERSSVKAMPVLPLLPRGFVEDIFNELNQSGDHPSIAFDPAMGQLVVMHKLDKSEDASKLQVTVYDANGNAMDQGWYFGSTSQGLLKAVFFNMQPGMYTVKVQAESGALAAVDTVAVDFWTTALVQTGATVQYDLNQPEVAEIAP